MFYKSQILKQQTYKTGQVAKLMGVSIQTVINYCEAGFIPYGRTAKNYRVIEAHDLADYLEDKGLLVDDLKQDRQDVIYARVSTHKQAQQGDLDRQIEAVKLFAITHNVQNLCVKSDIGSGLNDNRKQLNKLLSMVEAGQVNRIFILHKDRLTHFGFHYLKRICDFHHVEIVVVSDEEHPKSESEALAADIVSLIHSLGKRNDLRHKIKELLNED